jgi:predicted  nucleic acid-binding Zn-ribbon protein
MKGLKICIALLLISAAFSTQDLRMLDEEKPLPEFKTDMKINGENLIEGGVLDFDTNSKYLCVKGGVVSNSVLTAQLTPIKDVQCFPYLYITGAFNRFNPFNQYFYFRVHAPAAAGFEANIKVKFHFKGYEVDDLDKMFALFNKNIIKTKLEAKSITDILFKKSNEYNRYVARFSVGSKSIPEIKEEIQSYADKIARTQKDLEEEEILFNNLTVECEAKNADLVHAMKQLSDMNNKAENLDTEINNNKISIQEFEDAIANLAKAIAETEERIRKSQESLDADMKELRRLLPTEKEDLDSIEKGITARKIDRVNNVIDQFVNSL